ncbi:DnaB-like helicase C-terminal domain-containing protein [Lysinibacillus sp. fls2-241-R2A-57]|uniref:replicative DNA helicase n=1 Tax=Lysinibacillus sp. fls2-241-R2A-57 TaxID=3040292 RepID=UPI002554F2BE|nr:DnaB-like helicase C-terminal domain-containing protein [Lysinibacillus sp. fls2-241-R2A-57]
MTLIGATEYELEAEQSVLGAIFLEPSVIDDIVFLEARDFISARHQQIFRVMKWLDDRNQPIDITTVTELYMKHNKMDEVSISYLAELAVSCPTAVNVVSYANIVRSRAIRRRGTDIGQKIMNLVHEDYEADDDYFAEIEKLASEVRPEDDGKMQSLKDSRQGYFEHLLKRAEFIPTGFKYYDKWAHGLWRGWLFVSAGRPSVGKTAMLLQRIMGVAKSGPVIVFSQEMDKFQLFDRMIASSTGIAYGRIKNKELKVEELGVIEHAYKELEKLPIFVQDSSGVTIEEVRATARRFKKRYGQIAMIAVDYLQIMKIPQRKNETRAQAVGNVTTTAKQIARDMNCCFMMLSQMTRESDNVKKPQLSHLKESSSIEQDADVVEFLWHDPADKMQQGKVIQQFFAKGRDIGMNEFKLLFMGWKQKFIELDKQ